MVLARRRRQLLSRARRELSRLQYDERDKQNKRMAEHVAGPRAGCTAGYTRARARAGLSLGTDEST